MLDGLSAVPYDFADVKAAYPSVARLLGQDWLTSQAAKSDNNRRRIAIYLERAIKCKERITQLDKEINDKLGRREEFPIESGIEYSSISRYAKTLTLVDSCLDELRDVKGLPTLIKQMKGDGPEFISSVSVAILACFFKQRARVGLFPPLQLAKKVKKTRH